DAPSSCNRSRGRSNTGHSLIRSVSFMSVWVRRKRKRRPPVGERRRERSKAEWVVGFAPRQTNPAPQHLLYFLPEPQGQGSLRPTFGSAVAVGAALRLSSPRLVWSRRTSVLSTGRI